MKNQSKFDSGVVIETSSMPNCQENSSFKVGVTIKSLRPNNFVGTLKVIGSTIKNLIGMKTWLQALIIPLQVAIFTVLGCQNGKVNAATFAWDSGHSNVIIVSDGATYPIISATVKFDDEHDFGIKGEGEEIISNGMPTTLESGDNMKWYDGTWPWHDGYQWRYGNNSNYGHWTVTYVYGCGTKVCQYVRFEPNTTKINTDLKNNKPVVSNLTLSLGTESVTLSVIIGRIGVNVNWDSNIELDNGGNPAVSIDPSETVYADLLATLSVVKERYDYFNAGSEEYLNGGTKIVGANSEQYSEDRLPPSFSRPDTRTYGRGWSNGSGRFRGGVWFFDGKNHLVAFQPMKDRLDELNAGDVIESHLSLYLIRGGGASKRTLASLTLKVTIRVSMPLDTSAPNVIFEWDIGYDGTIVTDTVTESPAYMVGLVRDTLLAADAVTEGEVVERRNGAIVDSADNWEHSEYIDDSSYVGFSGSNSPEFRVGGSDSTYGDWYFKALDICENTHLCGDFMFVPRMDSFENLADGDVITSTYTYKRVQDTDRSITRISGDITVTITVDLGDNLSGFAVASKVTEVSESGTAVLNISLDTGLSQDVTIPYTITPDSAEKDTDYTEPATTQVMIAQGQTTAAISIPIVDDSNIEPTEQFTVTLNDGANYTISPSVKVATVRILDDDLTVSVSSPTAAETSNGTSSLTFDVSLAATPESDVAVSFSLNSQLTTAELSDYALVTTSPLTFAPADQTLTQSITVNIVDDQVYEGDEKIVLSLSLDPAVDAVFSNGTKMTTAEGTITDAEDMPEIGFDATTHSVEEGESIDLTLVASLASEIAFPISFTPSNVKGNFLDGSLEASGRSRDTSNLTFELATSSNRVEATFSVATRSPNGIDEENGEISITLDSPAGSAPYTIDDSMKTVNIAVTDTDIPKLSIRNAADVLAGGIAKFQISSDIEPWRPLTVKFAPSNLTASFLDEGEGQSGTVRTSVLEFPAGSPTMQTLNIRTTGDSQSVAGVVQILLVDDSEPKSYTLADGNNNIATVNVAISTVPSLSIIDAMVVEAGAGASSIMRFEVVLNPATAEVVTVDWNTEMLLGSNSATAGVDFESANGTLRFGPNDNSEFISVTVIGDDRDENNERFAVNLTSPSSNSIINNGQAIGTIRDGSLIPRVSIATGNSTVMAGDAIQVQLNAAPTPISDLNVRISVVERGNVVVLVAPRFVRFRAGSNSASFTLYTGEDGVGSVPGQVEVRIVDGESYNPGSQSLLAEQSVTFTVQNRSQTGNAAKYSVAAAVISSILINIPASEPGHTIDGTRSASPEIEIHPLEDFVEEGSSVRFRIASVPPVTQDVTVNLRIAEIGDFIGGNSSVSVALFYGQESAVLEVPTVDDDSAEADGLVTAEVKEGVGYRISSRNVASVIVRDEADRKQRRNQLEAGKNTFLPEILAAASSSSLQHARNRSVQAFAGGAESHVDIGEFASSAETFSTVVQSLDNGYLDWSSVVGESAFSINLFPEAVGFNAASIWGQGERLEFTHNGSSSSNESWNGETLAGHIGFESQIDEGILVGLTATTSNSKVNFGSEKVQELDYNINMTGLHPFVGIESRTGDLQLQATAGYGVSSIEQKNADAASEFADGNYLNFGLNGQMNLLSIDNPEFQTKTNVDIFGTARMANQTFQGRNVFDEEFQVDANRFQVVAEGVHTMASDNGDKIVPAIALGLLGERKGNRNILNSTISNGLDLHTVWDLNVAVANRIQLRNPTEIGKWALHKSIEFDSKWDNLGLQSELSFMRETQFASGSFLIANQLPDEFPQYDTIIQETGDGLRLDAMVGYGVEILDGGGRTKPFIRYVYSGKDKSEYGFGNQTSISKDADIEVKVSYFAENGETNFEYGLNGSVKW